MYQPYDFQFECLDAIDAARSTGRALVVMATGLGKTIVMAFDALKFRAEVKKRYPRAKRRVLFLCHNNDILYQTKPVFEAVNGSDCSYGYFNGDEKNYHQVDFLFATLQTMEQYKDLFDPEEFAEVVVDESHHSQAETFRSTIEYFKPRFLLGGTATPDRLDELDIRDIFGQEVYSLPLEEAMARGLLTPVDYRLLTDDIQLPEDVTAEDGKRISLADLNRKIFIPRRDQEIAKIIARNVAEFENPRTIIFCASIAHAQHMAKYVADSFAIHSKIPGGERSVRMEMFKLGLIETVLVVDAFNEGVDVPQANVLVFLRSTDSRTIFLQQLGRGLRKSEGKSKVIVLDFVANCERVEMIYKFWKGIEKKRGEYAKDGDGSVAPMTLNVNAVEFIETIVPILRIIDRVRANFYPTWQEASAAAIELDIRTMRDYQKKYRMDPRLPAQPYACYPDFPGMEKFLAKAFYSTWQEASAAALALGIKNRAAFQKKRKEDKRLYCQPDNLYEDFPGWPVFLGRKPLGFKKFGERYKTWQKASAAVVKLGISNQKDYKARYTEDPLLPADPSSFYSDTWKGWPKFFGRKPLKRR